MNFRYIVTSVGMFFCMVFSAHTDTTESWSNGCTRYGGNQCNTCSL